ncbi:aspartate carbamoyltransferase catalytic subunit [Tritonibacter scottomollicae]|uniref:aspartate carbamoyltransferase catalytic subunit n=1 Tax=Tritonibacter scottomollicae TaxID=483013 RepID=UPI003AA90DF4
MTARDGWDGILEPGETVLWQGQPVPGFTLTARTTTMFVFGLVFSGSAWFMITIMVSMDKVLLWMLGLPFLAAGLSMIAGATVWPPYVQKYTWYTLTQKRAMIATAVPLLDRRLDTYPISTENEIALVDGALQTVYFATGVDRRDGQDVSFKIGFERISEGHKVYRLLCDIQAKAQYPRQRRNR